MSSFIDPNSAFSAYTPFLGTVGTILSGPFRTGQVGLRAEVTEDGTYLPNRPLPTVLTPLQDPFASSFPIVPGLQASDAVGTSGSPFAPAINAYAKQNVLNAAILAGSGVGSTVDVSG